MKQKQILLIAVLVLVLLLLAAYPLYNKLSQGSQLDQLATLPGKETQPTETQSKTTEPEASLETLTVYDGDGNSVKISDYKGKPVVLNFWASWCGPCKSEMPEFEAVYKEMGDQVQFLMVNATTSESTIQNAKAFIQQSGYTFPVLFDTKGTALATYKVDAFPTTYFLDKTGNPVAYVVGAIGKATLLQGIEMITK